MFTPQGSDAIPDAWFRPRPYPHFDSRLSRAKAHALVTDPERVSVHAFLPFLSYAKRKRRYKPEDKATVWKPRPIAYAAHADSHIYSYYSWKLAQAYEDIVRDTPLHQCVIAYRRLGKSNLDHAAEAFTSISQARPCVAMAFDVESFFDSLRHTDLRAAWTRVLRTERLPDDHYRVFRSVTRYATVNRDEAFKALGLGKSPSGPHRVRLCSIAEFRTSIRGSDLVQTHSLPHGIPQGSPMSAVLSNIYMLPFDERLAEAIAGHGGLYRRYSDDILIVCPTGARGDLQQLVADSLQGVGLRLNSNKTEVVSFSQTCADRPAGLQYLGLTYDGQRILLRPQSLARFYQRLRRAVRTAERESRRRGSRVLLFKGQLYRRFSHHPGSRSFVRRYALYAASMPGMAQVRRQVARHMTVLRAEISAAEARLNDQAAGA